MTRPSPNQTSMPLEIYRGTFDPLKPSANSDFLVGGATVARASETPKPLVTVEP